MKAGEISAEKNKWQFFRELKVKQISEKTNYVKWLYVNVCKGRCCKDWKDLNLHTGLDLSALQKLIIFRPHYLSLNFIEESFPDCLINLHT